MQTVTASQPSTIRAMFAEIAGAYDLANSVLSLGIHKRWKRKLVRQSGASLGAKVLDCATGTGDLAFEFERRTGESGQVIATDFCAEMLEVGRQKALRNGSRVIFDTADATALPFGTSLFDVASISFGIRNTSDPAQTLKEMARVVKPGGTVMVLEFGTPRRAWLGKLFNLYSNLVLPRVGGWLSGKPEAYRYLQKSSAAFPYGDGFLEMAQSTGSFSRVSYEPLQGGIAYLYQLKTLEGTPC